MDRMSSEEYEAVRAWAEPREWTWGADFCDVYRAYLRTHREQPPTKRRYRVPRGVVVGVGPAHVSDEREWDWHD